MGPVINNNMYKVGTGASSNNRQCAKMHEDSAVPIQAPDCFLWFFDRNPEGDHTCMPHGTDGQEIMGMVLAV